jgi:hypothetical protein
MARKRDNTVKLVLRLPPGLHRTLKRAAAHNDRSLNNEMLLRLEASLRWPGVALATGTIREASQKLVTSLQQRSEEQMLEAIELLKRAAGLLALTEGDQSQIFDAAHQPGHEEDGEQK